MKQTKRQLFLLCTIIFMTACGGAGNSSSPSEGAYQIQYSDSSVLAEQQASNICIVNGKLYFVGKTEEEGQDAIYVSGAEDEYKSRKLLLKAPEGEYIEQFIVSEEGELYITLRERAEHGALYLSNYSLQGDCKWKIFIEQDIMFVTDMLITKDGHVMVASDTLLILYTKAGEQEKLLEFSDSRIQSLCLADSGKVYLYREFGKEMELIEVKLSAAVPGERISLPEGQRVLKTEKGIFTTDGDSLYQLEEEKKQFERKLSLLELNIDGSSVNTIAAKDAGGYIICFGKEGILGDPEIALINEKSSMDAEEQTQDIVKTQIRFATAESGSVYRNAVVAFNRSSTQYEIVIPKYTGSEERSELIKLSFLSEEAPDIVEMAGGFAQDAYQSYARSGYLADLTDYMKNSDSVKQSEMLPKVLQDFTVDDKLYGLPVSFTIYTLACPGEALEGRISWTIEEFLDFMEQYPNAYSFPYASVEDIKVGIFQVCMYQGLKAFVDWENETATFNGERFKNILRRIRDLEVFTTIEDDETRSMNGEILISTLQLNDTRKLQQAEWRNGHGKSLTLIGFPSGDEETPSGGIAFYDSQLGINGKTKEPEGAWSFVENQLMKAFEVSASGFPTSKRGFEEKLREETEVIYQTDDEGNYLLNEKGEKMESFVTVEGVPYPAITKRQVEEVRRAAETMFVYRMVERDLIGMIQEEARACFDNSKTVEDVADIIQNRVALYLKEK